MSSRTAHLREQLAAVLTPFTAPVPTNIRTGVYLVACEASDVAAGVLAAVDAASDEHLDEVADRAVMHLIGVALGRDPSAGLVIGNPLTSLQTTRAGEGASRVARALLELWAGLERPLPASAITAAFAGAERIAETQRRAAAADPAPRLTR